MSVQVKLRRDTYANIFNSGTPLSGAQGEVWVDTTNMRLIVNDGVTGGGFSPCTALSVQNSTTDKNLASATFGTFFSHATTFTIPANFMINKRAFRVTAHFQFTCVASPPTITFKLLLGTAAIYLSAAIAPAAFTNVQVALQWVFQATAAPGASVNVQCAAINQVTGIGGTTGPSLTAMPVAIATNAAQAVTIATEWSATATSFVDLNQLIVEALN